MTRNGVAAEGSMLGLFSERLPGRLRREPGLSWGDSVKTGRERVRQFNSSDRDAITLLSPHPGQDNIQSGPYKMVQLSGKSVAATSKINGRIPMS